MTSSATPLVAFAVVHDQLCLVIYILLFLLLQNDLQKRAELWSIFDYQQFFLFVGIHASSTIRASLIKHNIFVVYYHEIVIDWLPFLLR